MDPCLPPWQPLSLRDASIARGSRARSPSLYVGRKTELKLSAKGERGESQTTHHAFLSSLSNAVRITINRK